jgi:deoxycytidylate deaminase
MIIINAEISEIMYNKTQKNSETFEESRDKLWLLEENVEL